MRQQQQQLSWMIKIAIVSMCCVLNTRERDKALKVQFSKPLEILNLKILSTDRAASYEQLCYNNVSLTDACIEYFTNSVHISDRQLKVILDNFKCTLTSHVKKMYIFE